MKKRDIVMPMKFQFRWIPFVAAVLVAAVGILLGEWQTRRAMEKEAIEAKLGMRARQPVLPLNSPILPQDVEYRRVTVTGHFMHNWNVYLDNRPMKGEAGFYVLTPLKIDGSDKVVVVARGWVKRDVADRTRVAHVPIPEDSVSIEGIARNAPGKLLQLGTPDPLRPNAIVQNVTLEEIAEAGNMQLLPFVIEQANDTSDGLVREWPRPSTGSEKHRGYAFQWRALAAMALAFFVVTGFRRERR